MQIFKVVGERRLIVAGSKALIAQCSEIRSAKLTWQSTEAISEFMASPEPFEISVMLNPPVFKSYHVTFSERETPPSVQKPYVPPSEHFKGD